jgi:phosphoribosyl 1,2-cyclic phosphodiesterase
MDLCVLASGSGGNCSVIKTTGGVFLVDCGIGPRITSGRLNGTGVSLRDVQSICVTHLDRDHFNVAWMATIVSQQLKVFCPADRVHELLKFASDSRMRSRVVPFGPKPFEPVPGVTASTLRLAHDRTGSHAFHFTSDAGSIGYATDLGNVPTTLIEKFCGVDLLAIESNYDPHLQRTSGRPLFLQNRITGGGGHLSNNQALKAVKALFDRCARHGHAPPQKVVLLHRSRQCNCPVLLRELFETDARIGPRVVLTEQYSRTEWITARRTVKIPWMGEQLSLQFG